MSRNWGLVLLSLAGGIAIGYLWGRGEDAPERRDRPLVPFTEVRAPMTDREDAARRVPTPTIEPGTGEFRGHVTHENGEPFEGALVVATPQQSGSRWRYRTGEAAPRDESLEKIVRDRQALLAARREARTGPDGAYRLTGLADGEYIVRAYAEGFRFVRLRPGRSGYPQPDETIDFRGHEMRKLMVDVIRPDGSRPLHATIYGSGSADPSIHERWYRDEPWIHVRPQRYHMHALDQEQRKSDEIEVDARSDPGPLVFRLKGRPGIRGMLIMPDGCDAIPAASVYAMRYIKGRPPTHEELARAAKRSSTGGMDVRATYLLNDLTSGTYLLGLSLNRWSDDPVFVLTETVEVGDDLVEHDLHVPAPQGGEHLLLRVHDPRGNPVRKLKILTYYRAPQGVWGRHAEFLRRVDGSFLVRRPTWDSEGASERLPDGQYTLDLRARPWGSARIPFDPVRSTEVVHRFEDPAFVHLTIPEIADRPGPWRARMDLRVGQHYHDGSTSNRVKDDGKLRLGPFQPGEYDLVVSQDRGATVLVEPIELRPGEDRRIDLRLPELHSLTVRMANPGSVTWLTLQRKHGGRAWGRHSARFGRGLAYTFESLAPGTYEIEYGAVGGGRKKIEVVLPGPSELQLP